MSQDWLTAFMRRILEALDGRALTASNLQKRLNIYRDYLYKRGLHPLMDNGLVKTNRRVGGYFRPDATPAKYAGFLRGNPKFQTEQTKTHSITSTGGGRGGRSRIGHKNGAGKSGKGSMGQRQPEV